MRRTIQALKNPQIQLAIAALAIGVGATTAIYTVVHAVLLEPLPWSDSSRWSYVFGSYRGGRPNSGVALTYKNSQSMQARLQTTDAFGCYDVARLFGGNYNATFNGQTLHLAGLSADPKTDPVAGIQPSRDHRRREWLGLCCACLAHRPPLAHGGERCAGKRG